MLAKYKKFLLALSFALLSLTIFIFVFAEKGTHLLYLFNSAMELIS